MRKIDKELVTRCRNGDYNEVVHYLISNKNLESYIRKLCNGDRTQYKTVQHDTILSFIRTCMNPAFELRSSPIAYLKVIAKNLVLAEQRKKQIVMLELERDVPDSSDFYQINQERKELLAELLEKIAEDCRKILNLWALKFKMSEIAARLDISSIPYAKKKKSVCLKKLIKLVENNPKLKKELRLYV